MEALEMSTFSGRFNRIASEMHNAKENILAGLFIAVLSVFVVVLCAYTYVDGAGVTEGTNLLMTIWTTIGIVMTFFGIYVFCVGVSSARAAYKNFNKVSHEMAIFVNRR